ncbi:MAG: DMT family transporter [Chloroflexota bacterium]
MMDAPHPPRTDRRQLWADALLLLVTLIWGSTFVMVKDAVATYPVFSFLALRFGLATAALLVIGGRRLRSLGWRGAGAGVLIGVCLLGGYAFQTLGLQHTSASKAGFITGLYVVIVPALSALVLRKRPPAEAVLGVILATIGLGLLSFERDLTIARGDLLVLACALSFGLHIVAIAALGARYDPIALTTVQVATVAVASAVISSVSQHPWTAPSAATWGAAAFTGILATALAFGIQTAVQRFTTPTHTALIFTGEPVFAALFGFALGGDVLTPAHLAGGALIIIGTLVSEVRWSVRTAQVVSRFLSPHYMALPLILVMALADSVPWWQALLWSGVTGLVGIAAPLAVHTWSYRRGRISDWHISERRERVQPVLILTSLAAATLPLALLLAFDGPRALVVVYLTALVLVVVNVIITLWWKISQHVASAAASTALLTAALGPWAAPLMLLIPLVAWARIKVGAHTVRQTLAGGLAGLCVTLLVLRAYGLA